MKLKTQESDRELSADIVAKVKKYAAKHKSAIAKWEKDAKFTISAIATARDVLKKSEAEVYAAEKLFVKVWPKFQEAKKKYEAAKKGGDKKAITEAERNLKKWDDVAHQAAMKSAGGHGGYWGAVTNSEMYASELTLKMDKYY